jgi:hypothetical protein
MGITAKLQNQITDFLFTLGIKACREYLTGLKRASGASYSYRIYKGLCASSLLCFKCNLNKWRCGTMRERPIVVKYETNIEARERLAERLKKLNSKYDSELMKKAYPYLFGDKNK